MPLILNVRHYEEFNAERRNLGQPVDRNSHAEILTASTRTRHPASTDLTTQRNPMWHVEVSTGCAWRAAGR